MADEKKWYYSKNKERNGPFGESQFIEMIKSGALSPESPVWTKGFEKWQRLKNTELASYTAGGPPPLPVAERQWFYAENQERNGPFGESQFVEMIKSGALSAKSYVWTQDLGTWKELGQTELAIHISEASPSQYQSTDSK